MISDRLQAVRTRIADAARRARRPPESVRLICVTKSATVAQIQEVVAAGATDLAENRVQSAESKVEAIGRFVQWHMIGHLQRNKAKAALQLFDWIHSVDGAELAQTLERHASAAGSAIRVLVEVNTSGEANKYGVLPNQLAPLLQRLTTYPHLQVQGLMTMAPVVRDPARARPYFQTLRELAATHHLPELSMGMSQDYEVAVEEGATMIRVGGAIFG